jgi:hypothetical protein
MSRCCVPPTFIRVHLCPSVVRKTSSAEGGLKYERGLLTFDQNFHTIRTRQGGNGYPVENLFTLETGTMDESDLKNTTVYPLDYFYFNYVVLDYTPTLVDPTPDDAVLAYSFLDHVG